MVNREQNTKYFALKLHELMQRTGTTQVVLAKNIGVVQQVISQYLHQTAYPKIEVLLRLAAYFRVSLYELTGIEKLKDYEKKPTPELSKMDQELLEAYNKLADDDPRKDMIDHILLGIKKSEQ